MAETKRCAECGRRRRLKFFPESGKKTGRFRRSRCVDCHHRLSWEYMLGWKYGLTVEDYAWMMHDQRWRCRICNDPLNEEADRRVERPCLDHCHETGAARGILCNACNRGLGFFRDCPEYLRGAIRYLMAG